MANPSRGGDRASPANRGLLVTRMGGCDGVGTRVSGSSSTGREGRRNLGSSDSLFLSKERIVSHLLAPIGMMARQRGPPSAPHRGRVSPSPWTSAPSAQPLYVTGAQDRDRDRPPGSFRAAPGVLYLSRAAVATWDALAIPVHLARRPAVSRRGAPDRTRTCFYVTPPPVRGGVDGTNAVESCFIHRDCGSTFRELVRSRADISASADAPRRGRRVARRHPRLPSPVDGSVAGIYRAERAGVGFRECARPRRMSFVYRAILDVWRIGGERGVRAGT